MSKAIKPHARSAAPGKPVARSEAHDANAARLTTSQTPRRHGARYFARTTRGLEWVTAQEAGDQLGASVTEISHRLVRFATPAETAAVSALATADDVFEELASATGIGPAMASLGTIASIIDLVGLADRQQRADRFEVVASFVGRRNYSRYDIEDRLGAALSQRFGGIYLSRRDALPGPVARSWRAHLWDDRIVLGLRAAAQPLHRRRYRQETVPGALHPPVASAVALLTGIAERDRVFDPCCGSGTLLIEAANRVGFGSLVGMDINRDHVGVTLRNAQHAQLPIVGIVGDAADMPLADGCIDVCLANLPWGRQIHAGGLLATDQMAFWWELRRLLSPQGKGAVLLDKDIPTPDWSTLGLDLRQEVSFSMSGRWTSLYLLAPPADRQSKLSGR